MASRFNHDDRLGGDRRGSRSKRRDRDRDRPRRNREGEGWQSRDEVAENAEPGEGFIDKLKDSYGFIAVMGGHRQETLFFHYRELDTSPDNLNIGDEVQFLHGLDRKSNRAVATRVIIVPKGTIQIMYTEEDRFEGKVVGEARQPKFFESSRKGRNNDETHLGRITYQRDERPQRIRFALDACEEPFRIGDTVSFLIEHDRRDDSIKAQEIKLVSKAEVPEFRGIISDLKGHFGFIDRETEVTEIFFHFSEFRDREPPRIGMEVKFELSVRGKPAALNVSVLPPGSVSFEEELEGDFQGEIAKLSKRSRDGRSEDEPTRIRHKFENANGEIQEETLPLRGKITMPEGDQDPPCVGDKAEFKIFKDKRNGMRLVKAARVIEKVPREPEVREQGIVNKLSADGYGFIKCADRDARIFFHFSDVSYQGDLRVNDHVEFTVETEESSSRKLCAVKIDLLPEGTVKFEILSQEKYTGVVVKAAEKPRNTFEDRRMSASSNTPKRGESATGLIEFVDPDTEETQSISFKARDVSVRAGLLEPGDKVEFHKLTMKRTRASSAVQINVLERVSKTEEESVYGYISSLKESFGFIEFANLNGEIFFHFSETKDEESLKHGAVVSFDTTTRQKKPMAINVCQLGSDKVAELQEIEEKTYHGEVVKELPKKDGDGSAEGCGLIEYKQDDKNEEKGALECDNKSGADEAVEESQTKSTESKGRVAFGYSGLGSKKFSVKQGDHVTFQIVKWLPSGFVRAINVTSVRKDERETVVPPRPMHMVWKKQTPAASGVKFGPTRAPKGPDGTNGFTFRGIREPDKTLPDLVEVLLPDGSKIKVAVKKDKGNSEQETLEDNDNDIQKDEDEEGKQST
eukprot:m.30155 g.30155  ORF g.30155 m.30155 type:complete len:859 (+) comp8178_c0_seq2:297-2873(+)